MKKTLKKTPWKPKPKGNRGILAQKTKTWQALSRYVRKLEPYCITSGHPTTEAGHFIHNGDKPNKNLGGNGLWYDLRNIHGQCPYCNRHRMGNTALYALRLIERYGNGIIEDLHHLHQTPRKWSILELKELEDHFTVLYEEL